MSINSYIEAQTRLLGKQRKMLTRKVGNNTYLEQDIIGGVIHLKLHATRIISWFPDGRITIQGENWQTNTTRDRLNSFLPDQFYIQTRKIVKWTGSGRYDLSEWVVCKVGNKDEVVAHHNQMDLSDWDNLVSAQQAKDARRLHNNAINRPIVLAARRAERKAAKAEAEFAEAALDALFAADEAAAAARRGEWVSQ